MTAIRVLTVSTCHRCDKRDTRNGAHENIAPDRWACVSAFVRYPGSDNTRTEWVICWDCYLELTKFIAEKPKVEA